MNDDGVQGFVVGMMLIILIMFFVWTSSGIILPERSVDGRCFIRTHGSVYELTSPTPVNLIPAITYPEKIGEKDDNSVS